MPRRRPLRSGRPARGPQHERGDAALVVAVRVALAPQRLRLGGGDAGDGEDRQQDHGLAAERDQAVRQERQAVERVADPDEPLEEVVLPIAVSG